VIERGGPAFVAIEWDSGILTTRDEQRALFREKWTNSRPKDGPQIVDALVERLGWESDAHLALLPDTPIVWLEQGRDPPPSQGPMAVNRLFTEQMVIGPDYKATPSDQVMPRICNYWLKEADGVADAMKANGRDFSRDEKWRDLVAAAIAAHSVGWGLIVVGALHASEWDDKTLYCMLGQTHLCQAHFLLWSPVAPGPPCGPVKPLV
jgi:hypothetical protein